MAKILYVSNIGKRVGSFAVASISAAKNSGHEFYYAANWSAATIEQRKEDEAPDKSKLPRRRLLVDAEVSKGNQESAGRS